MKKFEHDLGELKQRLVEMAECAATMIDLAIQELTEQNGDVSGKVLEIEERVNQMQLEIDRAAIRLLTVYGPVATDLRFVLMVSKINTELERIADQAVNMCEYLQLLASRDRPKPLPEFPAMAKLVVEMLHEALQALLYLDRERAEKVIVQDARVDALNHQVLRHGLAEPQDDIAQTVAEILLARALERIADQTTNICEEIVYIVSGDDIRHPGAKH